MGNPRLHKPLHVLTAWQSIMSETTLPEQRLLSFKEIDGLHQCAKGTAFRAFKRLGQRLTEGEHFCYLNAETHAAEIEALRQAGRIYTSTVNAVLLTKAGYAMLRQVLEGNKPEGPT